MRSLLSKNMLRKTEYHYSANYFPWIIRRCRDRCSILVCTFPSILTVYIYFLHRFERFLLSRRNFIFSATTFFLLLLIANFVRPTSNRELFSACSGLTRELKYICQRELVFHLIQRVVDTTDFFVA